MPGKIELTLYSKPDCPLCDEMEKVIREVGAEMPFRIRYVDISADAGLQSRYGLDIPVLMYGGEHLAKHRVHKKTLAGKLRKIMESADGETP